MDDITEMREWGMLRISPSIEATIKLAKNDRISILRTLKFKLKTKTKKQQPGECLIKKEAAKFQEKVTAILQALRYL